MKKALEENVISSLRKSGFTGSFPHFRRIQDQKTDLITFQFDKYSGGFVIEVAQHKGTEYKTYWGKIIELKKLTAWDLNERRRIQADDGSGGAENWFRYDTSQKPDRFINVANQAAKKLDINSLFK